MGPKSDLYVKRLESIIFSTEMCILQTRTYWKVGIPWDWNFKFLKCKIKYSNVSGSKSRWKKWRHSPSYVYFQGYGHYNVKNGLFNVLSAQYKKTRPSLGNIIKCFWKVLFSPFIKYYELRSSDLPLANYQHLKMQDFTSLLLTQHFVFYFIFSFISTYNISRTVTSKAY